jgi:hypothetical protein
VIDRLLLIRQSLLPLLAEQGYDDVIVATSYQPASEGRTNGPTLYFFQLPTGGNYGWQGRSVEFDEDTQTLKRTERQAIREGFQIMALNDTGIGVPPVELIIRARMLVASEGFREAIAVEGAGIERITEVRTPDMLNDQDHFEQSPSFDFTLTHTSAIIQQARYLERAEFNFTRV